MEAVVAVAPVATPRRPVTLMATTRSRNHRAPRGPWDRPYTSSRSTTDPARGAARTATNARPAPVDLGAARIRIGSTCEPGDRRGRHARQRPYAIFRGELHRRAHWRAAAAADKGQPRMATRPGSPPRQAGGVVMRDAAYNRWQPPAQAAEHGDRHAKGGGRLQSSGGRSGRSRRWR